MNSVLLLRGQVGLEPTTNWLKVSYSTNWVIIPVNNLWTSDFLWLEHRIHSTKKSWVANYPRSHLELSHCVCLPSERIELPISYYKYEVIPFNYEGFTLFDTSWNRTSLSCVKGKSINRYTIAPFVSTREERNRTSYGSSWDSSVTITLLRNFCCSIYYKQWGSNPQAIMTPHLKWSLFTNSSMLAM